MSRDGDLVRFIVLNVKTTVADNTVISTNSLQRTRGRPSIRDQMSPPDGREQPGSASFW
jgi:hypothetical protein